MSEAKITIEITKDGWVTTTPTGEKHEWRRNTSTNSFRHTEYDGSQTVQTIQEQSIDDALDEVQRQIVFLCEKMRIHDEK